MLYIFDLFGQLWLQSFLLLCDLNGGLAAERPQDQARLKRFLPFGKKSGQYW
jgi:hypothetical protein